MVTQFADVNNYAMEIWSKDNSALHMHALDYLLLIVIFFHPSLFTQYQTYTHSHTPIQTLQIS